MAGLKRQYVCITDEQGKIIGNGANQAWFSDSHWCNVSGQGCGIIAALDLCHYVLGQRLVPKAEYEKEIKEFVKAIPLARLYMHEFFGKIAVGLTPIQICRFLNRRLKGKYKVSYNGRNGHNNMLEKMEAMLSNDIPVIWSLYRMGKRLTLYTYKSVTREYVPSASTNSHYVNAISIIRQDSDMHKVMIKISSWGKIFFIDYDEYLEYVGHSILSSVCSNIFFIKKTGDKD